MLVSEGTSHGNWTETLSDVFEALVSYRKSSLTNKSLSSFTFTLTDVLNFIWLSFFCGKQKEKSWGRATLFKKHYKHFIKVIPYDLCTTFSRSHLCVKNRSKYVLFTEILTLYCQDPFKYCVPLRLSQVWYQCNGDIDDDIKPASQTNQCTVNLSKGISENEMAGESSLRFS